MAIEVGFDPVAEAVYAGLLMDERHEVLPDGQWVRWARRWTGREGLFVYRHRETEKFVLADWLVREPRVCLELEVMDLPPDRGGWPDPEYLRQRCRPASELDRERFLHKKRQDRLRRELQIERGEERRDKARFFKRRGQEEIAASLTSGGFFVGEREGGDSLEEMRESLTRMARLT